MGICANKQQHSDGCFSEKQSRIIGAKGVKNPTENNQQPIYQYFSENLPWFLTIAEGINLPYLCYSHPKYRGEAIFLSLKKKAPQAIIYIYIIFNS